MKLWLLRPVDGLPNHDNPWDPWYDKAFGFVVRAETEAAARDLAHENSGDENYKDTAPWKDPKYSSCVELLPQGVPDVVIRDHWSA